MHRAETCKASCGKLMEAILHADASPLQWEGLTGVPLDTNDNVSFILLGAPTFAKIDDLLRGISFNAYVWKFQAIHACQFCMHDFLRYCRFSACLCHHKLKQFPSTLSCRPGLCVPRGCQNRRPCQRAISAGRWHSRVTIRMGHCGGALRAQATRRAS